MTKKYTSLVLAILIIIGCLCGCTDQGTFDESTNTSQTTTAPSNPMEDTAPADGYVIDGQILNFFYLDAIQQQFSAWSSTFGESVNDYLKMYYGLDVTRALNQQIYDQKTSATWADYFVEIGKKDAVSSCAIYELAKSQGYKLTDAAKKEYDNWISTYEMYAQIYSISPDELIAANYGEAATFESWKEYLMCVITAQDYAKTYADSLTFDEAALREAESGREAEFSTFTFATYHLSYNKYPQHGTTAENGSVSFTDEQKKTALEAARQDALSLSDANSIEELNNNIAKLPCNSSSADASCTVNEDTPYDKINELIRDWLTDSSRNPGDCTVIANESTTNNNDGSETKTLNGYYVVLFTGVNDNKRPLANIRHLVVLSENDDAAAKEKAENLFAQWKKNPTEENFISLVKEHSDDSSAEYGGLYEDLAPNSPYVPEFLSWALDENRKKGDCEIIKTQYGYHLMYYVSDDEVLYRDLLISQQLEEKAYNAWYDELITSFDVTFVGEDTIKKNHIISPGS